MPLVFNRTKVYLNGVDISNSVYKVEVSAEPGSLTIAKVALPVDDIYTLEDENGNPTIVYRLGKYNERKSDG